MIWLFPNSHESSRCAQAPALEYAQDPPRVSLAPTPRWLGAVLTWRPNCRWALGFAAITLWVMLNLSRPSEFIYWQF